MSASAGTLAAFLAIAVVACGSSSAHASAAAVLNGAMKTSNMPAAPRRPSLPRRGGHRPVRRGPACRGPACRLRLRVRRRIDHLVQRPARADEPGAGERVRAADRHSRERQVQRRGQLRQRDRHRRVASDSGRLLYRELASAGVSAEKGLLAQVESATLGKTPSKYNSPQGDWVGVSARVSVLGKLAFAAGETDFQPVVTSIAGMAPFPPP